MSLRKQHKEIERLIEAFAIEANNFHDLSFGSFIVTQDGAMSHRKFAQPSYTIMLWQYYGALKPGKDIDQFMVDLQGSDLQWGLRGAQLSSFAVIEGKATPLFLRMAKRAGSLFDEKETRELKHGVLEDIIAREKRGDTASKPTAATNDNPLAIWLNYLLYHVSMTNPGREKSQRIEPDPFSLSLLALERLAIDPVIGRVDRPGTALENLQFKIALSFPGERRPYVAKVAKILRETLGNDTVFYDYDYQAQLARPNMDTLLQDIYRRKSDLIVVFLCAEYSDKQWCGLEWRAIRDIIKWREDHRIMFVRFDDTRIDGVFSIDGYIDAQRFTEDEVAGFIAQRLGILSPLDHSNA